MKITASQIALEGSREAYQHYHSEESLQTSAARGDQSIALSYFREVDFASAEFSSYQLLQRQRLAPPDGALPHPSAAGGGRPWNSPVALQAPPSPHQNPPHAASGIDENAGVAADVLLIKLLLEMMSGREIYILHVEINTEAANVAAETPVSPAAQPAVQFSVDYSFTEVYQESESTAFYASGTVETASGANVAFDISLLMQRSYSTSTHVETHAGNRKDPLVINLNGGGAQLSAIRYSFDLNGDGRNEAIAFATGSSAFLALDLNADGIVNNGGELFGTQSGNGFSDLAKHDEDGNGFIDEGDSVFARLLAYSRSESGAERTVTLKSLGIGALYLGSAETSFDLRTADNGALGTVRASGVFLNEDYSVGTLQQVDLVV